MSAPVGYYDESYPPEVLRGYTPPAPPVVGAARVPDGGEVEVSDELGEPAELVATDTDAEGEALPEVDPSSYPPDAVDLEHSPAPAKPTASRSKRSRR